MSARYYKGREVLKEYKQGRLVYEKSTSIPGYLCFTALEAGQFTLTIPAAVTPTYLSYVEWSKDGRTWNHTDNTSEAVTIDVQVASGEKVYWRGSGSSTASGVTVATMSSKFSSDCRFDASGNIMSMLLADNFDGVTSLPSGRYTFAGLFHNCSTIVNAEHLLLSATTLRQDCYRSMFLSCTSLVTPPSLPSTTLAPSCYLLMFGYCRSITTAPVLPATTLTSQCYYQMFYDCVALTTAPALPATSAVYYCYYRMFEGCTGLTSAPELPATRLFTSCYQRMFYNCTKLNYVKCMAEDLSYTNCVADWLYGVSSTGTFIQAEGVEWPRGASGIPTGWVDVEKRTMPQGYKQLLQVTSNGTAYIQLSFGFEDTDEVAATFSVDNTQSNDKYIVSSQTWNSNNNRYGLGQHLANHYYTPAFGGLSTGQTCLTPLTANNGELHNWTYASRLFTLVDLSLSKDVSSITFGGVTTNLRLFYGMAPNNTKGAISSYKHIKGSTTACDFVAAIRESDNTAGLYDLANDEFMTCNGLTAGEEI